MEKTIFGIIYGHVKIGIIFPMQILSVKMIIDLLFHNWLWVDYPCVLGGVFYFRQTVKYKGM
jgi:hypothetical protein